MKALAVKMETVIVLVKVDRIRHVLCIKCMKSVVKYFIRSRCFIFARSS